MGKKIIFVLLLLLAGTTLLLIYEHRRGRGEAMEHAMMELTRLYRKSIRFGADLSGVKRATGLILNAQSALDAGDEGSALRFMNEAIDVLRGLRATYDREWSILISTKKPSNNLYSG
ncbi:TPA: hypothetical protein EYP75_00985, partial [Candidatus Bathyarchaeota archaeon]|nr:hypothetical protein [Candidatus Bathyarchaeota archaeon]